MRIILYILLVPFFLFYYSSAGSSEPESCDSLGKLICENRNQSAITTDPFRNFKEDILSSSPDEQQIKFRMKSNELFQNKKDKIDESVRIVDKVLSQLISKVSKEVQEPERDQMIKRLKNVKYNKNLCSSGEYPASAIIDNPAFYDPISNEFTVCPKLLMSNLTEAEMTFIIAHEISHSIDPCRLGQTVGTETDAILNTQKYNSNVSTDKILGNYPYSGVLSCLRKSRSAKAIERKNGTQILYDGYTPFQNKICFNDQINEAYADWMASEIISDTLKSSHQKMSAEKIEKEYKTIFASKCEVNHSHGNTHDDGFETHPDVQLRADAIFMTNPKIRKSLKCKGNSSDFSYCAPPSQNRSQETSGYIETGAVQ